MSVKTGRNFGALLTVLTLMATLSLGVGNLYADERDGDVPAVTGLPAPPSSIAALKPQDSLTFLKIKTAHRLFNLIVRLGLGEPYRAPLYTGEEDVYFAGGLDPVALIERYKRSVNRHPSGVVFASPGEVGDPRIYLRKQLYPGGPEETILFVSEKNRDEFEKYYGEKLFFLNGGNCMWGAGARALTDTGRSHWAQPAYAQVSVITLFAGTSKEVNAVGLNLNDRGPDWVFYGDEFGLSAVISGYVDLIFGIREWSESQRPNMPLFQRHEEFPIYRRSPE